MTIKAVVFDIGGVLETTPPTNWEQIWEDSLGLQPGAINRLLRDVWLSGSVGTITEEEVEKRISDILGLDTAQVEAFMTDLWNDYMGTLNSRLAEFFVSLRPRYQTAILSNSFVGARRREHARYGFGDMCDLIIYSHEEGIKKPDPAIFSLTCKRLGVQPSEMIFLDDVEVVVAAAQQAGIHAILFKDTDQAIADILCVLAES